MTTDRMRHIGRTYARVLADIETVTGLKGWVVASRNRTPEAVAARRAAWWITREVCEASLPEVGWASGHHHTSVLYGVRRAMRDGSASRMIVLEVFRLHERREAA